ncbi:uncharacterized protein [Typha latifolia]|uniref:uncharacterized protein isoform X3 n=1 Tax=Typha latifolia TaxID=4733 RepID=UPI003C2EF135
MALHWPRQPRREVPVHETQRIQVGFDMIDAFARSQGIAMTSIHCKALFGEGSIGGVPVLLAKPQTYMNLSGESTGPLAAYFKLPLNRIIVVYSLSQHSLLRMCINTSEGLLSLEFRCLMIWTCHVAFFVFNQKEEMDAIKGKGVKQIHTLSYCGILEDNNYLDISIPRQPTELIRPLQMIGLDVELRFSRALFVGLSSCFSVHISIFWACIWACLHAYTLVCMCAYVSI